MMLILKKIYFFIIKIYISLVCKVKSEYYSFFIDEGIGKFIVQDLSIKMKIVKKKGAKIVASGNIILSPHVGGDDLIVFILEEKSSLTFGNDFIIGNGVKISLNSNAVLSFGGKDKESGSGITANSTIMCYKSISIGKDFLCASGVFITDSDWHLIENQHHQADVIIGDHVWIANNSSVHKGAIIANNSIIASQSKVTKSKYPSNSVIAGIPAKVVRTNINWSRDL